MVAENRAGILPIRKMGEPPKGSNRNLDKMLKEVSYSAIKDYKPEPFSFKFISFIKMITDGMGEENTTPLFHYLMLDNIDKNYNNLIVAFRGSGKSSICAEYLFLYCATFGTFGSFGDVSVAMYVGDTMDNGCKSLRSNLQFRYEHSEFLHKFIKSARFTDTDIEFENAAGHWFYVKLFGMTTGIRGFKRYSKRPTLVVIDDVMSEKSAASPTIVKDIENTIYKAIRQAMHPTKRKIIWIGTPFNKKDPLYKAVGSKGWSCQAFPVCERFPCTKEEFVGAWEDRFPYSTVRHEYELLEDSGNLEAFNQELMLKILSDESRLIDASDIIWFSRTEKLKHLDDCHIYITTDFATSENQSSDFSVISVWALDSKGVFNWIDGIVKRQDMSKNVNDIFRFVGLYKPLLVGVEISGQQKGFVSWIKRDMVYRRIFFTLATDKKSGEEGLRPTVDKLQRFNVVLPLFKQRKIAFPIELKETEAMQEFLDELTYATANGFKSLHDDCIDTISQIAMLDYVVPYSVEDKKLLMPDEEQNRFRSKYFKDYWSLVDPEDEKSSYIV